MILIVKVAVMGVCFDSNSGGRILSFQVFGVSGFLLIDDQLPLLFVD